MYGVAFPGCSHEVAGDRATGRSGPVGHRRISTTCGSFTEVGGGPALVIFADLLAF